ncbi:MAG: hypothetical protein AAB229_07310 [Candidatus Hydrogenedentota bacterium]|mgnify:CR=1 FL=1
MTLSDKMHTRFFTPEDERKYVPDYETQVQNWIAIEIAASHLEATNSESAAAVKRIADESLKTLFESRYSLISLLNELFKKRSGGLRQ